MSKTRKGISSILSNVLLILITVLGMAVLFAFTTHYVTDFQLRQGSAIMEGMVLEDAWFTDVIDLPNGNYQSTIILNLYNFGKVDLSINQIYINGKPENFLTLDNQNGEPIDKNTDRGTEHQSDSIEIRIGEHGGLIIKDYVSNGIKYHILIITERNSKFEFEVRRP